jgi:formiminoglutamase
LYDFARNMGATTIHTSISRTVIDVNRDPSGASLYPGQATTGLCPTTTFDGEPLYKQGREPDDAAIAERRRRYFEPYHEALKAELQRLRAAHKTVVLYDCHSIRTVIPRLFDGELPTFNIGTNKGASCDPALAATVYSICAGTEFTHVLNGRFTGGWITRTYGKPADGFHAVQMELACRGYMREEIGPVSDANWPTPYDPAYAAPMRNALSRILNACLDYARA